MDFWKKAVYASYPQIVKPERIVYSLGGGKPGDPSVHFISTWTFEALGDRTRVTMRNVFETAADRDRVVKQYNAVEGANQTLDRFGEYLNHLPVSGVDGDFVITRTFDAPRELIFKAFYRSRANAALVGPQGFHRCQSQDGFATRWVLSLRHEGVRW